MHRLRQRQSRSHRASLIAPVDRDSLDEILLVSMTIGRSNKLRLPLSLLREGARPHVRNPDLHGPIAAITHPFAVAGHTLPNSHTTMLHVTRLTEHRFSVLTLCAGRRSTYRYTCVMSRAINQRVLRNNSATVSRYRPWAWSRSSSVNTASLRASSAVAPSAVANRARTTACDIAR